jgi:hypothetical protein
MQDQPKATAISRRRFLEFGAYVAAGALLGNLPAVRALGADIQSPLPAARDRRGSAKSIIQIWLWGGASHLDTFDPKPGAGRDYCGPYDKPIATNVPGIEICQMLPLLASMADRYTLLRSMTHGITAHETAAYLVQAGRKPGNGLVFPSVGAITSYFAEYNGAYQAQLPPYIAVTTPPGRFSQTGFLGAKAMPYSTGGDPSEDPVVAEGFVQKRVTEKRQKDRRALLRALDTFGTEMADDPLVQRIDAAQNQAYAMILGDVGKVFSLELERPEVRDRYGRSRIGQSCLLARRLVAEGVPFVTINYGGWDTHKDCFQTLNQKLPEFDKALSALLQDLADRGLLDSTIVWVSGEFGRTPQIQWEPPWNGGRGHYGKAFSALVAGGGFRGGTVVGKTDERGEIVIERPIYPWDLLGSFYELLGIDHNATLPTPQGDSVFASPFAAQEITAQETGGILKEIMIVTLPLAG